MRSSTEKGLHLHHSSQICKSLLANNQLIILWLHSSKNLH
jgi:hypothetical protein